jgi:P-type conjugative transfer protein TrbJ
VIDVQSIAQEIMQVTHQVTQITNQMTQIQNQVTSLGNEAKMLTTLPLDFTADLAGALQQFQSVLQTAQGLSYTAMDAIAPFRALYPELYDQAMSVAQIASQGQQWISQTRRAIETATQGPPALSARHRRSRPATRSWANSPASSPACRTC